MLAGSHTAINPAVFTCRNHNVCNRTGYSCQISRKTSAHP
jgi:hypothetical protein